MGQYFILVNLDKKEFISSWDIDGLAKFFEWCANKQAGVIPFLLRQSTDRGGGDINEEYKLAGHWAGDRITLVGDYGESKLYDEAIGCFKNISQELVKEFNDFIQVESLKLKLIAT